MEDVFEIQDQIAADIIDALQLQFSGEQKAPRLKRYTENLEAYQHYLQGRYHWFARTKGGLQRAMQYFEQAIEKDSNYALAHSGLADLHSVLGLYGFVRPTIAFAKAGACAERALSIDKALAEGHLSSAFKTWLYDFDWLGAERGFRQSLELNPRNPIAHVWYAHLLTGLGRDDEANRARERAQDLDPLSAYVNAQAALNLICQRRHEEAVLQCRKALDVEPSYLVALYRVGAAYTRLGKHDDAVAALERAVSIGDRASFHVSLLGSAYAMAGRGEDARRLLGDLEQRAQTEYVSPLCFAWVLGALGDLDRACEHLEGAFQERSVRRMGLVC